MEINTAEMDIKDVDCNCNDCTFMARDLVLRERAMEFHKKLQFGDYERRKNSLVQEARALKPFNQKAVNKALKYPFQFDKSECTIHYGYCDKFKKNVTFIPEVCQIETQHCFKRRTKN